MSEKCNACVTAHLQEKAKRERAAKADSLALKVPGVIEIRKPEPVDDGPLPPMRDAITHVATFVQLETPQGLVMGLVSLPSCLECITLQEQSKLAKANGAIPGL